MRSFDQSLDLLKALAEPTRLRLVALLCRGDLSVKDLTSLLGQSQPRLSRHLKLLTDAGWIVRSPEGAWVYYRMSESADLNVVWAAVRAMMRSDDRQLAEDAERLQRLKQAQSASAEAFFQEHAVRWDALRADLVPEAQVEAAILDALGTRRVDRFLDVGTGTGRMLVLLQALYASGLGIDTTHAMLQVARSRLADAGVGHAQVRHGDGLALGLPRDSQDLVSLHQVMHFFDDPRALLAEAARVLAPGGRLLIVDFGPHQVEALRSEYRHRRLGFDGEEVGRWLKTLGLHVGAPIELRGGTAAGRHELPVMLWLAHDPRRQVDAPLPVSDLALA